LPFAFALASSFAFSFCLRLFGCHPRRGSAFSFDPSPQTKGSAFALAFAFAFAFAFGIKRRALALRKIIAKIRGFSPGPSSLGP
jgi:hypothetical protein